MPISARSGPASSAARPVRPAADLGRKPEGTPASRAESPGPPRSGPPPRPPGSAGFIGPRRTHGAPPGSLGPPGSQPLDQDRIEGRSFRPVDQLVEQLVVPGGGHREALLDLQLLRPRAR